VLRDFKAQRVLGKRVANARGFDTTHHSSTEGGSLARGGAAWGCGQRISVCKIKISVMIIRAKKVAREVLAVIIKI